MAYTEIKKRNERTYYYRVLSIRKGNKVGKQRRYLGVNISENELSLKETQADKEILSQKINKSIENIKQKILPLLKKNNIKKAGIFGSYARGEQKKNSDIDIIIEPPEQTSMAFINLAQTLEKTLGKKVDLITYKYINKHIKKYILNDEVKIL